MSGKQADLVSVELAARAMVATVRYRCKRAFRRLRLRAMCRATRLMAGPVASSKNVTRDFALVAGDRSASIYCTSIADSSPSASSADDLPNTISCAISRRHSFKRRCSVRI
jgi:hypothetical protein